MKPAVNIIATFNRIKTENGADHFAGTLDLGAIRKTKLREVEIVLAPAESIPKPLAALIARNPAGRDGLIMFAAVGEEETTPRKKQA